MTDEFVTRSMFERDAVAGTLKRELQIADEDRLMLTAERDALAAELEGARVDIHLYRGSAKIASETVEMLSAARDRLETQLAAAHGLQARAEAAEAALLGLLRCRSVDILEDAAREYPHGKEDVADIIAAFDAARAALALAGEKETTNAR